MRTSKKVTRKELDSAFEKALKDISGIRKFSGDLIIQCTGLIFWGFLRMAFAFACTYSAAAILLAVNGLRYSEPAINAVSFGQDYSEYLDRAEYLD